VEIEFDPVKDEINRKKHGLSLSLAAELDWDDALCWEDIWSDYGEQRFNALVPMGDRLYYVTYTYRHVTRAISLREADNVEKKRYVRDFS
jgi:uncharacterized DUF497 family protein